MSPPSGYIEEISSELQIPDYVKQSAVERFDKLYSSHRDKITNRHVLMALTLLISSREHKQAVLLHDLVNTFKKHNHKVTTRNIYRLAHLIDIDLDAIRPKAIDYVERVVTKICQFRDVRSRLNRLKLNYTTYSNVLVSISQHFYWLIKDSVGGVNPYQLAVSIVYLADRAFAKSRQRKPLLTQKLVTDALRPNSVTIRHHISRFLGEYYTIFEEELIRNLDLQLSFQ